MAAGTSALLLLAGGAVTGVAALTRGGAKPPVVTTIGDAAAAPPEGTGPPPVTASRPAVAKELASLPRTSDEADRTATRNPRRAVAAPAPAAPRVTVRKPRPSPPAPSRPVRTTRTDLETRAIPYETRVVRDPALPRGTRRVESPGVPGEETLRYLVTLTDGQPTARRLVGATVTRQPRHRIVVLGTRQPPARNPECGQALNICVPLGRGAVTICPSPQPSDAPEPAIVPLDVDALGEWACAPDGRRSP